MQEQQELKYQEEQAKRDHELKMLEAAKANDNIISKIREVENIDDMGLLFSRECV